MLKSHERFHSINGKRQILVADDELINRELMRAVLQDSYELLFAANGQEALDLAREYKDTLSLILLDLMMPVMSGMDMLKTAKADPEIAHIPVIVISADQNSEIECLTIGATDFIQKPYPVAGVIQARVMRTIELYEDRQIIRSTERDSLTGLYNREYFYRYAEQFDLHHKEAEMDAIVVDVNHFHMINERFGTAYGDKVLRRIGKVLRATVVDSGGIVCRREADTFLIYCPSGIDPEAMLDDASIKLESTNEEEGSRVWLRMGIYSHVDKSIDIERRFDRAKRAADTVQGSFTRHVGVYDKAMQDKELYSEQLIGDFETAIAERQFKVYFQPKFDVRPDIPVLAAAEALVRWQHPKLGLISPGIFIPLFEENGLIQQLDLYVWRETAAKIREWKDRFDFAVPVSVNVSRVDMYDPQLVNTLSRIVEENGLSTGELHLEVTESAYTQDSGQIISTVNKLRELGFSIEMDDFGTGYSSLNMITTLPIDMLKLDMQFIRNAFGERRETWLIEVIIDIADCLGVPVIAEGVETEEQMLALKELGCDYVQGYYFSRPVPPEEYEQFVIERKDQLVQAIEGKAPRTRIARGEGRGAAADADHALTNDFDVIYYVDTETGHYVEFASHGSREDLQMAGSGQSFFGERLASIVDAVVPADAARVGLSLERDALLSQLAGTDPLVITYRSAETGATVQQNLKAVCTKSHDNRHIVIGIRGAAAQAGKPGAARGLDAPSLARLAEALAGASGGVVKDGVSYASVVQALALDYFGIYYIDVRTDHFIECTSHERGRQLGIGERGEDFFEVSRKAFEAIVHPDDYDMLLSAYTKQNILASLDRDKTFTLTYRIVVAGSPLYVHLKATRMEDRTDRHIVVGISDIDDQIRREQEHARAQRMANQDALTGVKSRHAYTVEERKIDMAIATGSQDAFALAICDINDLASINETLGRDMGDHYIQDACSLVCNVFKHSPVFRIGGDEFAALLRGGDYEARFDLMQRFEDINALNARTGDVCIAVGVAAWRPGSDNTLGQVFTRAETAMYENKRYLKGRGAGGR